MKRLLLLTLLLGNLTTVAQTTDSVRQILNQMLQHAETASLYRNRVDWDTLKPQVLERAKQAKSVAELGPALKYLLAALGDEHGRVFHQNQVIAYHYGEQKPHQRLFDPQIYGQVQGGQTYAFEAKILDQNIGYVRIVGLPMGDNQQLSQLIEDEVCRIAEKGVERWVVDLRYNGGGNMFPMAEGLAQIIGNGQIGGAAGLTTSENAVWRVKDGDFYYDDQSVRLPNRCRIKKHPKVAVLTSLYTASSGEALAVIFKGRKHTRFFGSKTLGMITVTDWTILDPGTAMTISVSYYKDRRGKVYREYVDVDEEAPFAPQPLSATDACLKQALAWLVKK